MFFDSNVKVNENFNEYCNSAQKHSLSGFCVVDVVRESAENVISRKPLPKQKDLILRRGIEIEFDSETHYNLAVSLSGVLNDYTVNSVHYVNGNSLSQMEYYTENDRSSAYLSYLNKVFDSLDAAYDYSVLGHITYVNKFGFYPSPALEYKEFPDIIDSILMRTVFLGKGLELDASSLKNSHEVMPTLSILRRYRELGGEILTFTSGAKTPEGMGKDLTFLAQAAIECGFKYYSRFSNMIPEMLKL